MKDLIYVIPPEEHGVETLKRIIREYREIKFVSLMGIDLGGNATDEKIPIHLFLENMEEFLQYGIQTDGSSVVLHEIATLNNARLDIIPDRHVNWIVDYNFDLLDEETQLPVGTLRIPSFLVHNGRRVDSRWILTRAVQHFKHSIMELLREYPHALENIGLKSADEIQDVELTSATELEFWVKTPEDTADIEKLSTSQTLKEQFWKRTQGTVRSALESTIMEMERYGFQPEMGHKEVGGVRSKIGVDGRSNHVNEQLEVDWKYSSPLQAADNELFVRQLVEDVFHRFGLEVTFRAKPIEGVAGSGEHTHVGVALLLKNGSRVNLFAPKDMKKDYLGIMGYGALMGILRNYEVINPFINSSIDAFNRLKPGFEAPVCIVTSLGHSVEEPSRNRSILVGLVRDMANPLATRFEVRSPSPLSNTYLVIASLYQVMLDGIQAAVASRKTNKELEREISKGYGEESFYLDQYREYRSEENVFEYFTEEERNKRFGIPPATPWENVKNLKKYAHRVEILHRGDVITQDIVDSVVASTIDRWTNELASRVIYDDMDIIRECRKLHTPETSTDLDDLRWEEIQRLKWELVKSSTTKTSLLESIRIALQNKDYDQASNLQLTLNQKMQELREKYIQYKRNLFEA